MDNMILELLKQLDFSERQQKVLVVLFGLPQASASRVAQLTRLKRPTVYAILDGLIDQGLVSRIKKNKLMLFSTVNQNLLIETLSGRLEVKYRQQREALVGLKASLQSLQDRAVLQASGFEIETLTSEEAIYEQLISTLAAGDFCGIFDPQEVFSHVERARMLDFLSSTAITKPKIRELAVPGVDFDWYQSHIKNPNHEIRALGKGFQIKNDFIVGNGQVIIANYGPKERVAIRIKQAALSISFRSIFEELWKSYKLKTL